MFSTTTSRNLRRSVLLAGLAVSAAAVPGIASAADFAERPLKINGGTADFGAGQHLFGSPSEAAKVTFATERDAQGRFIVKARVQGIEYWDALDPGCARVTIQGLDANNNVIDTQTPLPVCGPGGNANASDNKRSVDRTVRGAGLEKIKVTTRQELANGASVGGGAQTVNIPRTKVHNVRINSGTADFGRGAHATGAPTRDAQVTFERRSNGIRANVNGTLYYDSLFTAGCAKMTIDYLDASGTLLERRSGLNRLKKCGSGGDANVSRKDINEPFTNARVAKVKIKVGTAAGSSLVNVTTKTFSFTNV